LIGESWGGTVALKMAQILEAEGTLTTVTLLEGDPDILAGCAKHFLSNGYITQKLNSVYGSLPSEVIKNVFIIILRLKYYSPLSSKSQFRTMLIPFFVLQITLKKNIMFKLLSTRA